MDVHLHTKLNDVVEAFRAEVHQHAPCWSTIRTPSALFDFEQDLQAVLNSLQAGIVGAVLEAIHRDQDFVTDCQNQAWRQRGAKIDRWSKVRVRTLGGKRVCLKTPRFKCRKRVNQEDRGEKRHQQRAGLYPVLWRLGIVRGSTPRFLAEVNRHITDGPSDREVQDRLGSHEIRLSRKLILRQVRDFGSIALWQRQMAAAHLNDIQVIDPAPLAGKRVVVGLDGGRLRLKINKIGSDQTPTRQYSTDKCEPKLFALYTVDDQGKKERTGEVFYDGTLQSATELFTLLKLRLN